MRGPGDGSPVLLLVPILFASWVRQMGESLIIDTRKVARDVTAQICPKYILPTFKEQCISEVVRIGGTIIFHLSKL